MPPVRGTGHDIATTARTTSDHSPGAGAGRRGPCPCAIRPGLRLQFVRWIRQRPLRYRLLRDHGVWLLQRVWRVSVLRLQRGQRTDRGSVPVDRTALPASLPDCEAADDHLDPTAL